MFEEPAPTSHTNQEPGVNPVITVNEPEKVCMQHDTVFLMHMSSADVDLDNSHVILSFVIISYSPGRLEC